jgi:nitrous oxidase accessory protein NosD
MDLRLVAAVFLLAAAAPALAADREVGRGKRYRTIQAAVDAADPGDRIVVSKGVYRETVFFQDKDGLKFVGRGAVWDGQISRGISGPCLDFVANGVSVEGFTFRNGAFHVHGWGNGNTVRKCVSRSADGFAFRLEASDATVVSCRVSGTSGPAIEIWGDGADVRSNRCRNTQGAGIAVQGPRALVAGNTVRTVRADAGISVWGDDSQVVSNRVSNTNYSAIAVGGDDVLVRKNVCAYSAQEACLSVTGPRAAVEDNRVTGAVDVGILVTGEGMSVLRNRVSAGLRGAPGFLLRNDGGPGGGTVEDNVADRTGQVGFDLTLYRTMVRRCVAVECGRGGGAAFLVGGGETSLVACRAEGAYDTAFALLGPALDLDGCTARDATGDGFQVRAPGIRLTDCVALRCGGEGLDNGSTMTTLDGCTLKGNRIDLACDALNGAGFENAAALAHDNSWVTGGPDRQPERDQ